MMGKRSGVGVALAAALLLGAASASFAAREIVIGGLFGLSGKGAPVGIATRDVARMVVDDINRRGGINGAKLKLVVADTSSEPGQAVVALKKLIDKDKAVAICGPTTTGEIMACLKTIEDSQIPVVACVGGAAAVVPVEERKWVFKSPQKSSSAVARIYKHLRAGKVTRIGLLTATDKFGEEGEALLLSMARDYGMSVVAHEKFDPNDKDMSVQIGKIAAEKPQAMVVWTIGPAGGIVTRNARQLNVGFKIVQCHGQPDPVYIKLAGSAADGTIMPSTKLMIANQLPASDRQKKVVQEFIKQFNNKKLGEISTHSGYAWDAVQIIARGIRKAGTDPNKLRNAIENTRDYVGVSGIYNMSPKDHCGLDSTSLVMVEVKGGKWQLIK